MFEINPCLLCNGWCCSSIHLYYARSKKTVYKNSPHLRRFPFLHKVGKRFNCERWSQETGKCGDYENRPYFCRNFMCYSGKTWIEILEYGNDYY